VTSATARVPAKINLSLGVGPVRKDGFHQLATVYQALDVHDEVRATLVEDGDEIEVSVHLEAASSESNDVPEDKTNLAVLAARALQDAMGIELGARLAIRKVIPVAGGMAGGSADAAAALVACNAIWGTGLGREELSELAADIGSDVPFLLHGGTAVGGGRGENISPILGRGSYYWAIAVSGRGLSTPAVYAEFDRLAGHDIPQPSVPDDLLAALRAGDPEALGDALCNDLGPAALSLRPDLRDVLAVGSGAGALGSIVSGSGPTCLFLAQDESHRLDLAMALASSGVCADVIQARGPVPGAHLIT
jgi:4-diphosphocytidyl-2-C-methyl-D-erythritol kinase